MSAKRVVYPAHVYFDGFGGWGYLLDTHAPSADDLADVAAYLGVSVEQLLVEKCHLHCMPRVKRCDLHDWPGCDSAGDWHTHWAPVRVTDNESFHYTYVTGATS